MASNEGQPPQSIVERLNAHQEKTCMGIGRCVAARPRIVLPICIAMILFCLALLSKKTESDSYVLWIPDGSRLLPERAFDTLAFGETTTRTEYMINEIKDGSSTVLTQAHLAEVLSWSQQLAQVGFTYKGAATDNVARVFKWEDVCDRPATPSSLAAISNGFIVPAGLAYAAGIGDGSVNLYFDAFELPCTAYTPLDCFAEGMWNYHVPDLNPTWNASAPDVYAAAMAVTKALDTTGTFVIPTKSPLPNRYKTLKSFKTLTDAEIQQYVKGSCKQWLGVTVPINFMYGAITRYQNGTTCDLVNSYDCPISTIKSTETVWTTMAPNALARKLCITHYRAIDSSFSEDYLGKILCPLGAQNVTDKYEAAAETIIMGWEQAYMDAAALLNAASTHTTVRYVTERSTDDLLDEAAAGDISLIFASYVLLIIWGGVSGWRNDWATSQICTRFWGCILIAISTFGGIGLSAIFGIMFTPTTYQVLPFLGLGLGVADLFVLADTYRYTMESEPFESLQECMREAGASITVASATNLVAFLCASAAVPINSVSSFSASGAVIVVLNWFMNVFGFTACMVIAHQRMRRSYSMDVCCMKITNRPSTCCGSSSQVQQLGSTSAPRIVKIASHGGEIPGEAKAHKCVLWYADFLSKWPVKIFMICLFGLLLGLGIWGTQKIEDGQPMQKIVPKSSYAKAFLDVRTSDYGDFPGAIQMGMKTDGSGTIDETIDWTAALPSIFAAENALHNTEGINKVISVYSFSAWDLLIIQMNFVSRNWVPPFAGTATCNLIPGCTNCDVCMSTTCYSYPTPFMMMGPQQFASYFALLGISPLTWAPWKGYNGSTAYDTPCVRYPKTEWMPFAIKAFLSADLGATSGGSFAYRSTPAPFPAEFTGDRTIYYYQPSAVQTTFIHTGLYTTEQFENNIRDTRAALDPFTPHVFPQGYVYNTYEQYLNARQYLARGLAWSVLGVALVSFVFLLSPIAVLIMLAHIVMTVATIYGFLAFMNLEINGVTASNTIMAVGACVAFTAYTTRAFLIAKGTRNERMKEALYAMCLPTLYGGIAIFLGILLLAGAKFPYFKLYYFNMYVLVITLGLGYGLMLLPVVLSIMGPPTLSIGSAYSQLENKKSPTGRGSTDGGHTVIQMTNTNDVSPLKPGELPPPPASAEGQKRNAWG